MTDPADGMEQYTFWYIRAMLFLVLDDISLPLIDHIQ
jgi:hypothetical protein